MQSQNPLNTTGNPQDARRSYAQGMSGAAIGALPGMGLLEAAGYTPKYDQNYFIPTGLDKGPSIKDNLNSGNYGLAALQGLGAAGDIGLAAYAGSKIPKASQRGIFAGIGAKTADIKALETAKKLESSGIDSDTIWKQTGWGKGADDKWRFEIDDSAAKMTDWRKDLHGQSNIAWDDRKGLATAMPADRWIDHPKLDTAYWSNNKNVPGVYYDELSGGTRGRYDPQSNFITMNQKTVLDTDGGKSTALHELQHSIQNIEGFQPGYNPIEASKDVGQAQFRLTEVKRHLDVGDAVAGEEAQRLIRQSKDDVNIKNWVDAASKKWTDKFGVKSKENPYGVDLADAVKYELIDSDNVTQSLQKEYNNLLNITQGDGYDLYRKTMGEVEARNVQTRMNMSADERRATPPWKTEDVARDKQIVRFGGGKSMSLPTDDLPMDEASRMARAAPKYKPKIVDGSTFPDPDTQKGRMAIQGGPLAAKPGIDRLITTLDSHGMDWKYSENGGITAYSEVRGADGKWFKEGKHFDEKSSLKTLRDWLGY
jgi:hypothetical protein